MSSEVTNFYESEIQLLLRDLEIAINLLPEEYRIKVWSHEDHKNLIELVLDYGNNPLARFPSGDFILSDTLVTDEDLYNAVLSIGKFDDFNRAGLEGTLHRISCIRDREDRIYGLTIRIGRALTTKTAALVEEPLKAGKSILLIGPPGVGKTSAIRNFCRMLSEDCKKRVMIVDTSNEIAGPGRVSHPAVGTCRRMQVKHRSNQHNVMIEAVQNHMPEVIVVDEIGKEEECEAVRSISQRGVQVLATTHGYNLEGMIKDRILRELIGGINDVVISDINARERKSKKKTRLERVDASCFDVIVEMATKSQWRIHYDANSAVDAILSDSEPDAEIRYLDAHGNIVVKRNEEEHQNLPSFENTIPAYANLGNEPGWNSEPQFFDDWDMGPNPILNAAPLVPFTTVMPFVPEANETANTMQALTLDETNRLLNPPLQLNVLQAENNVSNEKLGGGFTNTFEEDVWTDCNDEQLQEATIPVQQTYSQIPVAQEWTVQETVRQARLQEATRILNASTHYEVLKANANASKKMLKKCFTAVSEIVVRIDDEDGIMQKARTRLERAFRETSVLWEMKRKERREKKKARRDQASKQAVDLTEARRIMNASSDLEVLKANEGSSIDELKQHMQAVYSKVEKTNKEDGIVKEARSRVQAAYLHLRNSALQ